MGEVSYVWADPNSPAEQVALSALVRAMDSCTEDESKIKDTGTLLSLNLHPWML